MGSGRLSCRRNACWRSATVRPPRSRGPGRSERERQAFLPDRADRGSTAFAAVTCSSDLPDAEIGKNSSGSIDWQAASIRQRPWVKSRAVERSSSGRWRAAIRPDVMCRGSSRNCPCGRSCRRARMSTGRSRAPLRVPRLGWCQSVSIRKHHGPRRRAYVVSVVNVWKALKACRESAAHLALPAKAAAPQVGSAWRIPYAVVAEMRHDRVKVVLVESVEHLLERPGIVFGGHATAFQKVERRA